MEVLMVGFFHMLMLQDPSILLWQLLINLLKLLSSLFNWLVYDDDAYSHNDDNCDHKQQQTVQFVMCCDYELQKGIIGIVYHCEYDINQIN